MKCPKCGKEMEKGLWLSGMYDEALLWVKEMKPGFHIYSMKSKEVTVIRKPWKGPKEAFICKKCKVTCAEYE